jgi:integrase
MARRTRKRGNGEGSVQQLKDGTWRAVLTIGIDPKTGAQRRRYRRTETRTAAVTALKELQEQYEHLDDAAPQTVADYLERWLTSARDTVRARTYDSYAGTLRRHVIPHIGSRRLDDLKPMVVQGLFDRIATEVSPKQANYVRTVLNIALNEAVRWQVIGRNPVVATKKKKASPKQPTIWTPDQIRRVLEVAKGHRLYAIYYLVFTSGLRHGELLGLTWADVEDDAIIVRRTVSTRSGKAVESEPKSASGRRIVPIDPTTRQVLEEHRARQRDELTALGMTPDQVPERVFTNRLGGTLDASNVTKTWHAIQDEAQVPRARMHDARHMHLSYLVGQGIDIRTIADRAGHADEVLTLRQYSHALEAQRKRAAIPLDDLLGP